MNYRGSLNERRLLQVGQARQAIRRIIVNLNSTALAFRCDSSCHFKRRDDGNGISSMVVVRWRLYQGRFAMFRKRSIRILGVISLSCAACGSAWAQAPATPPPTLWSFLGIPQAAKHLHETIPNRFGKHPGLEKKPPVKP